MPQVSVDTYRTIFDASPFAILIADDAGRLIDANPAAEDLTGYTRDELLRMRVFDLTLEELRHDTDALWAAFLGQGELAGPFDLQRRDGTRRRVHYLARARVAPGAHMSMLRDLTREEATFRELEVSEQLLTAVFEHSPLSLQVFAPDGRILRANRAWERLWGVERTALAGYNVLEDEQLRAAGVLDRVRAAFAGQTVVLPMIRYVPALSGHPGRARWLGATCVPVLDAAGQVREVVLALEDLTERRHADLRASIQYATSRILAEASGIAAAAPLIVRAIGETLEWTYGALWLNDRADTVLRCVSTWTASEVPPAFADGMRREFPAGEGLPGHVVRTREPLWIADLAASGVFRALADSARQHGFRSAVAIPILVDTRAVGAFEFFGHAVAELDEQLMDTLSGIGHQVGQYIERRIAERAEAAAAMTANHLKDEFLAVLSHELRTPLNAILGWARLLSGSALDEAARVRGLKIIERNAQAQAQIVEDLLDVSRIITGNLRLDIQRVDVSRLANEMMDSMRPAADAKGIELVAAPTDEVFVAADPHRLQQVVWNLLSNAIKFTPAGGQVTIAVRKDQRVVELAVSDTGAGIPADLLPRVFDRFLQGDSSTTRQHGGLGLGLAIVRHLTELHGGAVSAESEGAGKGATFRVRLPVSGATGTPR